MSLQASALRSHPHALGSPAIVRMTPQSWPQGPQRCSDPALSLGLPWTAAEGGEWLPTRGWSSSSHLTEGMLGILASMAMLAEPGAEAWSLTRQCHPPRGPGQQHSPCLSPPTGHFSYTPVSGIDAVVPGLGRGAMGGGSPSRTEQRGSSGSRRLSEQSFLAVTKDRIAFISSPPVKSLSIFKN